LRAVLPPGLQHDAIVDQEAAQDTTALHLLTAIARGLLLEGVDPLGVVAPATDPNRRTFWSFP
jgi:hypothetical protein